MKVNPECELVLTPRLLIAAGSDPKSPTFQARAYAFYVEGRDRNDPRAKEWAPATWADAEAGRITNSRTGEVREFNLAVEQAASEPLSLVVSRSPVVVVVVEPEGKMWAHRVVDYMIPLSRLYLEFKFEWQKPTPYTDLEWIIEK